ncbi:MAG: hypothetical protein K1060chlam1_00982 [Candidatus Anoxychlamydiales bacterium]|nr:hypothetical protein [Candidatus Anoxychlamydiales bacterium]
MSNTITPSSTIAAGATFSTPAKNSSDNAEKSSNKIKAFINYIFSKIAAFFRAFIGLFYKKLNKEVSGLQARQVNSFSAEELEEDGDDFELEETWTKEEEAREVVSAKGAGNDAKEQTSSVVGDQKEVVKEREPEKKEQTPPIATEAIETLVLTEGALEEAKNIGLEAGSAVTEELQPVAQPLDTNRLDKSHVNWRKVALCAAGTVLALGVLGWYRFSSSATDQSAFLDSVEPEVGRECYYGVCSAISNNVSKLVQNVLGLSSRVCESGDRMFYPEALNQSAANLFDQARDAFCPALGPVSNPIPIISEQSSGIWKTLETGFFAFKAAGDSI